jgi:hypothetical protein
MQLSSPELKDKPRKNQDERDIRQSCKSALEESPDRSCLVLAAP